MFFVAKFPPRLGKFYAFLSVFCTLGLMVVALRFLSLASIFPDFLMPESSASSHFILAKLSFYFSFIRLRLIYWNPLTLRRYFSPLAANVSIFPLSKLFASSFGTLLPYLENCFAV